MFRPLKSLDSLTIWLRRPSVTGGTLAVNEDENGYLIPNSPVFKVRGTPVENTTPTRTQRGIVKIKAKAQSPATALWKSIIRVLIRETDF